MELTAYFLKVHLLIVKEKFGQVLVTVAKAFIIIRGL